MMQAPRRQLTVSCTCVSRWRIGQGPARRLQAI